MTRLLWLLIGLLAAGFAQAQEWEWVSPLPTGSNLSDVFFLSDMEGWAVGYFGTVIHTTDGGVNWERLHVGGTDEFFRVQFVNSQTGWALGHSPFNGDAPFTIYRTVDGGQTWNAQFNGDSVYRFNDLAFLNPLRGIVIGSVPGTCRSRILRTINGGNSWTIQALDTLSCLVAIGFFNDSAGWAATGYGQVLRTSDGGANWSLTQLSGISLRCRDAAFPDLQSGWLLADNGTDYVVYRTVNGGLNWTVRPIPDILGDGLHVEAVDSQTCFAITNYAIYRTTDGGETWPEVLRRPYANYSFALTVRGNHLCAVSTYGAIFSSTDTGVTWTDRRQSLFADPDVDLKAVSFINTSEGWIGAENGVILHTTDHGETWDSLTTLASVDLFELHFWDAEHGWAATLTSVYFTDDGGISWLEQPLPVGWNPFYSIHIAFLDRNTGIAHTERWEQNFERRSTRYRTTDGGLSWVQIYSYLVNDPCRLADLVVVDARHVWQFDICRDGSSYSTDGGITWLLGRSVDDLSAPDSLTCWVVNDEPYYNDCVYSTTDGGHSWTGHPGVCGQRVSFANRDVGYIFNWDSVYQTTNGGQNWLTEYTETVWGDKTALADGAMWIVGDGGTVYHRRPSISATPEPAPFLPRDPSLAVYPNPFNPTTRIVLELPRAGRVRLELFDVTGRHVQTLLDELKAAGSHTIHVDGAALPSGVYFARLQANAATLTKKLVLLR